MYLVARRGALTSLARGAVLAGAAAVACVRAYEQDERFADGFATWRERPGKVVLRARGGQWPRTLEEPHALAGDADGESVLALPPRRRSERGPLAQLQAFSSELEAGDAGNGPVTYLLNPRLEMSTGKTMAQVAHAAVMAAGTGALDDWVAAGCPARFEVPPPASFDALCAREDLAAKVVDAGLTEVAPGTVTVLAVARG